MQALTCDGVVEGAGDAESIGRELMVLPMKLSDPYGIMTRAQSAILMGKRLGMAYDCTDDVAINQIDAQINRHSFS